MYGFVSLLSLDDTQYVGAAFVGLCSAIAAVDGAADIRRGLGGQRVGGCPDCRGCGAAEPVPRLRWSSAEQISGSGGCNAFAGRAVVNQGALQVGRLAATGRLCVVLPQGGQEDRFFKVLESAHTVRLVDGQLVLQDAAGQTLARFAKK